MHNATVGTIGFSCVRWEFSVSAKGRHIFGHRPKPQAAKPGHYEDLTETGNCARKVSGTQGSTIQSHLRNLNSAFSASCPGRGGLLKEFLDGDVPLGPWNP